MTDELDYTCRRFDGRVRWPSGAASTCRTSPAALDFTREAYPAHPSGKWSWLCCPCGAKFMTTGEQE